MHGKNTEDLRAVIAAHIEQHAPPGTLRISHDTWSPVRGLQGLLHSFLALSIGERAAAAWPASSAVVNAGAHAAFRLR